MALFGNGVWRTKIFWIRKVKNIWNMWFGHMLRNLHPTKSCIIIQRLSKVNRRDLGMFKGNVLKQGIGKGAEVCQMFKGPSIMNLLIYYSNFFWVNNLSEMNTHNQILEKKFVGFQEKIWKKHDNSWKGRILEN